MTPAPSRTTISEPTEIRSTTAAVTASWRVVRLLAHFSGVPPWSQAVARLKMLVSGEVGSGVAAMRLALVRLSHLPVEIARTSAQFVSFAILLNTC